MQITIHLKDNYLVDVGFNIIKGFIVFGGLSAVFGALIIAVFLHYSSSISPLPPNSVGKSLNFGNPSFMRNMAFS